MRHLAKKCFWGLFFLEFSENFVFATFKSFWTWNFLGHVYSYKRNKKDIHIPLVQNSFYHIEWHFLIDFLAKDTLYPSTPVTERVKLSTPITDYRSYFPFEIHINHPEPLSSMLFFLIDHHYFIVMSTMCTHELSRRANSRQSATCLFMFTVNFTVFGLENIFL